MCYLMVLEARSSKWVSPGVSVCLSCDNKTGGLMNDRNLFLTDLETKVQDQGVGMVGEAPVWGCRLLVAERARELCWGSL